MSSFVGPTMRMRGRLGRATNPSSRSARFISWTCGQAVGLGERVASGRRRQSRAVRPVRLQGTSVGRVHLLCPPLTAEQVGAPPGVPTTRPHTHQGEQVGQRLAAAGVRRQQVVPALQDGGDGQALCVRACVCVEWVGK